MTAPTLVVGYEQLDIFSGEPKFTPVEQLTPSEKGYRFEQCNLLALMYRLKGFASVEFTDAYGTRLTPKSIRTRYGPDGGIDCVIHIVTPTELGARQVAGRIRNIILSGDY